ncbi:hypothetical protein SEUCBS139899_008243 [Sporothrix eucalyptigena]
METAAESSGWQEAFSWDREPDWTSARGKIDNDDACTAALRGEPLPTGDLGAVSYTLQLCILRGIRYHDVYAADLHGDPDHDCVPIAAIRRTHNARDIMSNTVPEMNTVVGSDIPYCIWYPDVAAEETYRAVALRYPAMRYQVGRACAVAGYIDLYMELDLLPDISIAEEARDSVVRSHGTNSGSQTIFNLIVSQPLRYQVMDDYTRRVNMDSPPVARYGLNGDTAVVSTLAIRRDFAVIREQAYRVDAIKNTLQPSLSVRDEPAPTYFNITEDWSVDEHTIHQPVHHKHDMLALLSSPLPHDLPWGNKDLLILMAAYYGDVDRYARLRRPTYVSPAESHCINRGIYHSTAFAAWWSRQTNGMIRFSRSINARFIMVNDLSRISEKTPLEDLPRQIWYPLLAQPATYLELARRQPSMRYVVAMALIVADYADAWDTLIAAGHIEPNSELFKNARASRNPRYLETLQRICTDRGLHENLLESKYGPDEPVVLWEQEVPLYDGVGVNVGEVELYMAASFTIMKLERTASKTTKEGTTLDSAPDPTPEDRTDDQGGSDLGEDSSSEGYSRSFLLASTIAGSMPGRCQ